MLAADAPWWMGEWGNLPHDPNDRRPAYSMPSPYPSRPPTQGGVPQADPYAGGRPWNDVPPGGFMPRQPADPYAGLEDLRDTYPGVSPDELRRLRDRMDQSRRDDAANRYRQDMDQYAPQYERNRRAENQRLEEEMRRRQQQPQAPQVEQRDPREWRQPRQPGSPVGVYPQQHVGGGPPWSGPPQLTGGGQPMPGRPAASPSTGGFGGQQYAGMSKGAIFQQNHGYRYGERPAMGDMASWGSQQAAQAALPGRQITQYGPGSFGSAGGEPMPGGYGRQLYRPGMAQPIQPQSQGTPYGAPSPWGGAAPQASTGQPTGRAFRSGGSGQRFW